MKRLKRTLAVLLAVIMMISVMPTTVEAAAVKLSKTKITLYTGNTTNLKVTGTSEKVKWSSNKEDIVVVNSNGKVKALRKGAATITAKVGKKKFTCKVTVKTPSMNAANKTLAVGQSFNLKVYGATVTEWKSSNTKVVAINSKGVIKGVSKGTATITAKVGNKKYTCKITVKKPYLNNTNKRVKTGTTFTLKLNNATAEKWTSSNEKIATVNSNGKVKALRAGTATITAYAYGRKYTCKVTVYKPETISMNATMIVGESDELVLGSTTTKKWTSSNEKVVAVNSKGKIKALRAGKSVVSCIGADGNTYKCNITVYKKHEHNMKYTGQDSDYCYYACTVCGRVAYAYVDKEYTIDLGNGKKATVVGHIEREIGNEIFEQLNSYRVSKGLPKLKQASAALQNAADIRSAEIVYSFSHTRPNGSSLTSFWDTCYCCAENIAMGLQNATDVMTAWENSPGHNSNMLWDYPSSVAVSVFAVRETYGYTYYFVQLFGAE